MPIPVDIVTRVDRRALDVVGGEIREHFASSGRDIGSELDRSIARGLNGSNSRAAARQSAASISGEFSTGFRNGIGSAISDVTGQFGSMGRAAEGVFSKMTSTSGLAVLGVAGIGVAAGVVITQLYQLGAAWDDVGDSIATRTGKVGQDIESITDSVKNVAKDTAAPLEDIGDVAGRVVQSLHLTGKPLEEMTKNISILNEKTGDKLGIRELGKAFRLFGVNVQEDGVKSLDALYSASADTGIPLNELITTLTGKGAVAAKQFGLDIGETAALLTTFEQAGLPLNETINGLAIALKQVPDQGALAGRINEIKRLVDIGDSEGANKLAAKTFGRGFVDFLNAIGTGAIDAQSLNTALGETKSTVEGLSTQTDDWQEQWQILINTLKTELEPAASTTFKGVSLLIDQYLIRPFRELNDLVSNTASLFDSYDGSFSQLPGSAPGVPANVGVGPGPAVTPPGASGPGAVGPGGTGGPGGIFAGPGARGGPQIGQGGNSLPGGGGGGATPAGLTGNKGIVYQAMINAGYGPDQWPALDRLMMHESGYSATAENPSGAYGMFQFMPYTWPGYGPKTSDPNMQAQYGLQYIKNRYGTPSAAWAQYFNHAGGEGSYDTGGEVYDPDHPTGGSNFNNNLQIDTSHTKMGSASPWQIRINEYLSSAHKMHLFSPGIPSLNDWIDNSIGRFANGGSTDTVHAMLTPGEHVFTTDDVNAMGGQGGVYAFRNALHRNGGGDVPWPLPGEQRKPNLLPPGNFNPDVLLDTSTTKWSGEPGWYGLYNRILGDRIPSLPESGDSPAEYLSGFEGGAFNTVTRAQWISMITGKNRGWMAHLNVGQKPPIPGFDTGGGVGDSNLDRMNNPVTGGFNTAVEGGKALWNIFQGASGERGQQFMEGSWLEKVFGGGAFHFDEGGDVPYIDPLTTVHGAGGTDTPPAQPGDQTPQMPSTSDQFADNLLEGMKQGGGYGGMIAGLIQSGRARGQQGQGQPGMPGQPAPGEGMGPPPGPPPVAGRSPSSVGGTGFSGSSLVDMAGAAAGSMFPGGAAAAQVATKLANRAIGFGGQAISIGIQGIAETLLPNGSPLGDPSRNWLGKIASGIGGGRASPENTAGQSTVPMQTPPPISSGQGSGPPPGPAIGQVNFSAPAQDQRGMIRDTERMINAHGAGMGH